MESLKVVISEIIEHKRMIFNLAKYEVKTRYAGTTLGIVWLFLNPIIQIGIFAFVFGIGIRGNNPVGDIPFIIWMLTGLVPWFFIGAGINRGATSIVGKLGVASKMSFPLSVVPVYTILALLQTHLILLPLVFLLMVIFGVSLTGFSLVALMYFMLTTTIFLIILAFVTSTIIAIVRDAGQLVSHVVRFLFFMTPILWIPPTHTPRWFMILLRTNPLHYIVIGYRNAFLYSDPVFIHPIDTVYFWAVTVILLLIGTSLHVKFRKEFVDYQ